MINRELIKRLLDFPLDKEVCIDNHPNYSMFETKDVGLDDDGSKIFITNY